MRLIVVSNRVKLPGTAHAGGMSVGIEAAMAKRKGIWVGWSGDFETPGRPAITETRAGPIRFVTTDLPADTFRGYYHGIANEVLWPLAHGRPDLVRFDPADLAAYVGVNRRIAAVLETLLVPGDVVWVHDYHLFPLAAILRERGLCDRIGLFVHTPFAEPALLADQPFAATLADWLNAYDIVGVQTARDVDRVSRFLDRRAQIPGLAAGPAILHDPIGIDASGFARMAADAAIADPSLARALAAIGDDPFAIGIDRIDYAKAVPERIGAFSAYRARAGTEAGSLLQVAAPCRMEIPAYRNEDARITRAAARFARAEARRGAAAGLHLVRTTVDRCSIAAVMRRARVGLVTPHCDGMNLVAKEYVAAQDPEDPGVLILSKGAGVADELAEGALIAPSDDIDAQADVIATAFAMNAAERCRRWRAMMPILQRNDAERWATTFLDQLEALPVSEATATPSLRLGEPLRDPPTPAGCNRAELVADLT